MFGFQTLKTLFSEILFHKNHFTSHQFLIYTPTNSFMETTLSHSLVRFRKNHTTQHTLNNNILISKLKAYDFDTYDFLTETK